MATPSADLVIFGGTGDLSQRKLLPALYLLDKQELLKSTNIVCLSRDALDSSEYLAKTFIQSSP